MTPLISALEGFESANQITEVCLLKSPHNKIMLLLIVVSLMTGCELLKNKATNSLDSSPAKQKYNPYSNQWETVSPKSELQFNPQSGQWNYAPHESSPQYNLYERTWDMAPDNYEQKYNPYENRWETADPESEPRYNPYKGEWEYPR